MKVDKNMFVKNLNKISNEKKYYCYSPPLCRWLKDEKDIHPINYGVYCKPGKFYGNEFEVFIITNLLDECLKEWTRNKKVDRLAGVKNET